MEYRPEQPNGDLQREIRDITEEQERFEDPELAKELDEVLKHEHKINEGSNGAIFRLEQKNVPAALSRVIAETQEGNASAAVKLLKLYRPGRGQHEFAMQKKAYDLVSTAENRDQLANIPKPLFFKTLDVSTETQEHLQEEGILVDNGKVEAILMEYVPGEDLGAIIQKWIAAKRPDLLRELGGFDNLDDVRYTYNILRSEGFDLDQSVISQVENTLKLLHSNNIRHHDLHERNIMVTGPATTDLQQGSELRPQTYIVDFGAADQRAADDKLKDETLINRLKSIKKEDPAEAEIKENMEIEYEIGYLESRAETDTAYKNLYNKIMKLGQQDPDRALETGFASFSYSNTAINKFLVLARQLISAGAIELSAVISFAERKQAANITPYQKRRLQWLVWSVE